MTNCKKLLAIIVALVMLVSTLVSGLVVSAANPLGTLTVEGTSVDEGKDATVTFNLDLGENSVDALHMFVTIASDVAITDAEIGEVAYVSTEDFPAEDDELLDGTDPRLEISTKELAQGKLLFESGVATVAKVTDVEFTVTFATAELDEGDYDFNVTVDATDYDEADYDVITLESAITVAHVHAYGEGSVTPPTCVDAGYTTYTCACGHSYTEAGEAATGVHNYVEGICSVCGAEEPVEEPDTYTVTFKDADGTVIDTQVVEAGASATAPELPTKYGYSSAWDSDYANITTDTVVTVVYTEAILTTKGIGAQLVLESTFQFRFTFAKTNYTGGNLLYAIVKKQVFDSEGVSSYDTQVFEGEDLFSYDNDTKMAFLYSGTAAKEMTNEIQLQFYYEIDGVLYSSKVGSTSIASLTLSQMEKNESLRTLAMDMLNYGAQAQIYFNYRTDYLANQYVNTAKGTSVQDYASYATTTEPDFESTGATSATGSHLYGTGLSMNLALGNTVDLNVFITKGTADFTNYKFVYEYTTTAGTPMKITIPASELMDDPSNAARYRVPINTLAAKDLRVPITFAVYDGEDNPITKVATSSIAIYAKGQRNTAEKKAMVDALFRFSDSAYNVLGN